MLSDIEECVLERIMLGDKNSRKIAKCCGITELTLNVLVERLVKKGYLDWEMNPTEKAYRELKWVNGVYPVEYYVDTKKFWKMALEIAAVVMFFVMISIALWWVQVWS